MKAQLLIASIIITSCGPDQSKGGKDGLYSGQPQNSIEYADPEPKEVVTEYRKEGSEMALVLGSSADLPECDNSNDRQLVYLKDQKLFMTCDDGRWLEVDIKGEKGETGAQGPEGKEGAKGDDGATGPQGEKGEDGKPLASNEWLDPITGKRWLIGASVKEDHLGYFGNPCTGDWVLPTKDIVRTAVFHGLSVRSISLGSTGPIWTSDIENIGGTLSRVYIKPDGSDYSQLFPNGTPTVACLYSPVP